MYLVKIQDTRRLSVEWEAGGMGASSPAVGSLEEDQAAAR